MLLGQVGLYIFTDSSSARQLVTKGGAGKVRHLDGKLLWIQNRKGFKMVLMAGFTEPETPDTARVSAYDVLQELNAGNFLARRSLEDMRASTENDFGDIE